MCVAKRVVDLALVMTIAAVAIPARDSAALHLWGPGGRAEPPPPPMEVAEGGAGSGETGSMTSDSSKPADAASKSMESDEASVPTESTEAESVEPDEAGIPAESMESDVAAVRVEPMESDEAGLRAETFASPAKPVGPNPQWLAQQNQATAALLAESLEKLEAGKIGVQASSSSGNGESSGGGGGLSTAP